MYEFWPHWWVYRDLRHWSFNREIRLHLGRPDLRRNGLRITRFAEARFDQIEDEIRFGHELGSFIIDNYFNPWDTSAFGNAIEPELQTKYKTLLDEIAHLLENRMKGLRF